MKIRSANKIVRLYLQEIPCKWKLSTLLKAGRLRQRAKVFKRYKTMNELLEAT